MVAASSPSELAASMQGLSKENQEKLVAALGASPTTTNSNLVASFYFDTYLGFGTVPKKFVELLIAKALCNAAGGDGTISANERAWIKGACATKGFTSEELAVVDEYIEKCPGRTMEDIVADTKEFISKTERPEKAGRMMLFDCFRAAHSDGIDAKERNVVVAIAKELGIEDTFVDQVSQYMAKEEALKKERIALIHPGHPFLKPAYCET
jgi:tellurite resistance protein